MSSLSGKSLAADVVLTRKEWQEACDYLETVDGFDDEPDFDEFECADAMREALCAARLHIRALQALLDAVQP